MPKTDMRGIDRADPSLHRPRAAFLPILNMNDGWDDDDDLNISGEEVNESGGGWEDDEELFDDCNDDDDDVLAAVNDDDVLAAINDADVPPQQVSPPQTQEPPQQEGWGEGDEDMDSDLDLDDNWGDGNDIPVEDIPVTTAPSRPPVPTPQPPPQEFEDGWGGQEEEDIQDDELDLGLDDNWGNGSDIPVEDIPVTTTLRPPVPAPQQKQQQPPNQPFEDGRGGNEEQDIQVNESEGWEDHEDLFADAEQSPEGSPERMQQPVAPGPTQSNNAKQQKILHELQSYMRSLPHMVSSINAVLEYEYNTPEKAQELVDYYAGREKLAEYTRTKELPRMDYSVVLPHGHIETDKQKIAENFLPDDSLISRCANQSLLADLLQVIIGPDLLVRPQHLAVCVAHWCKFTIHLGERGDMVECNCHLHLSLPTADGQRLDVAELKVAIVFAPDQPMVQYKVVGIDVSEIDSSKLQSVVEFLQMMEGHFDEVPGHEDDVNAQSTPADMFRDHFVENSSKLFSQSTQGMKSALQEMGSIVNFQSKFNMVKRFIPDTDVMLAAEQEAMAMAEAQRQQPAFPRPPPQGPPLHAFGPRPPSAPSSGGDRPKSILGGMFRTGWSKLAQSVALPDDDPSIYGAPSTQPQLYRPNEPEQPGLYRREEATQPLPSHAEPPHQPPSKMPMKEALVPQPHMSPVHAPVEIKQRSPLHHPSAASVAFPQHESVSERTSPPASPPGSVSKSFSDEFHSPSQEEAQPLSPQQSYEAWLSSQSESIDTSLQLSPPKVHSSPTPVEQALSPSQSYEAFLGKQNATQDTPRSPTALPILPIDLPQKEAQEGWEEDDIIDDSLVDEEGKDFAPDMEQAPVPEKSVAETPAAPTPSRPPRRIKPREFIVNVDYNPDDDIIETRRRWVNPRPHRPSLRQ